VPTGVGINENSFSNSILKLYPNPANGIFNIEIEKPGKLKIYNTLGALVYETNFTEAGNFKIDIAHLANGIYHVKTQSIQGFSYAKLVKNGV